MDIRHEQRIRVMQVLYNQDVRHIPLEEALLVVTPHDDILDKCTDILAHQSAIDDLIHAHLTGWSLSRLNAVDRAILRLAVYELLHTDIPTPIILNEAVELSKEYSEIDDTLSSKFNNKLLDTIHKAVRHE